MGTDSGISGELVYDAVINDRQWLMLQSVSVFWLKTPQRAAILVMVGGVNGFC
jgi:hypothetical protein